MSCSIYIPSLPSFFDDFSLRKLFNDCGQIKECGVVQHETLLKSCGFVKFANAHCAKMAAAKKDQTILERNAIRVFVVWDVQETLSTIRVSNLPHDIHVNGLRHLFSPFGDIVNVKINKNDENTEADISFSRVEYAIRATDEMDGAAFGPNNGNLCVNLVNADARCFKWKRNGFEYITNPWLNQASPQRSNQQKKNASPPVQTRIDMWKSSISHSDILVNDSLGNEIQNLSNSIYTTSPASSVRSATSFSSGQSSTSVLSSTSNGKSYSQDSTLKKESSVCSGNIMQEPTPLTLPNVCYMTPTGSFGNDMRFNNDIFQSISAIPLTQNQIPFYGLFTIPSLMASINLPNGLPTNSVYPINTSSSPNKPCETSLTSLSNVPQPYTVPQTNKCLPEQSTSVGSFKQAISSSSQPTNEKIQKKQSIWSKEQEELGNFLHAKLKSQYPRRCEKLVGMILMENKIKNIQFVMENSKAFSEKVAYFNKLLDDIHHV